MTGLGQQFQAIATAGDRVPTKTADGKTYREIIPELEAFLEPSQHSEFKTGYDKKTQKDTYYCYLKWQHIRKRLDDVAGRDGWIVERTSMFIDEAGNPCLIGRMNILGVVKEAMGIGKAHEKWQGTKIENAEADLLKNLAEAHGVGRYLDNQPATIRYLWDSAGGNESVKAMARKLAVQYNIQLKNQIAEDNAIANSNNEVRREVQRPAPITPRATVKPKPQSIPDQIKELVGTANLDWGKFCAIASEQLNRKISFGDDIETQDEFNKVSAAVKSLVLGATR